MKQVISTQKEVKEFAKELASILKEDGVLRVEVKAVPVKAITDRQREVLIDLMEKLEYDPKNSALPETAKDASRLIAHFIKQVKKTEKKGSGKRHKTSTKRS